MVFPLPEAITENVTIDHDDHHVDIHKVLNNNVRVVSGTSDTLVLADFGKTIETTSASAVSVTVPPNSSVAFPIGVIIDVCQIGVGTVTVVQGSGVTIRTSTTLVLRAQYSTVSLRKRATDEWVLMGDTT